MASKMNYACDGCGMASGRRESVQRHINNPKIHNGRAHAIPFVEYLAGLARGTYNHIIHIKTRHAHGFQNPDEQSSLMDRIQERVMEKIIDKTAEEMVSNTSSSPQFSSIPNIPYPFPQNRFSIPGEKIFGIGGYICQKCDVIKPVIYAYPDESNDRSTQSLVYPVQSCYHKLAFPSAHDRTEYLNYNKINGFPTALRNWIRNIWSNKNLKLISLQIQGTKGPTSEPNDFNQASPLLSNNNSQNKGKRVKVIEEKYGLSSPKRSMTLYYGDSNVIQLSDVLSVGNHPSIRSTKVSNASILKAIEKSEQLITSEDHVLSFLSYAKFETFGFFGVRNETYLVMLIPEEYSLGKSYSCELC